MLYRAFILFLFLFSNTQAYAATYSFKGAVRDIVVKPTFNPYAVFYIEGFTAAGVCKTYSSHVIMSITNDERGKAIYSLVLSSYMAGKDLRVTVVDTDIDSDGYCRVREVRVR